MLLSLGELGETLILGNDRTWLLILGMSGLIILFWFVAGSVALRYLVCPFCDLLIDEWPIHARFLGAVHWCHVMHVRSVGCHR